MKARYLIALLLATLAAVGINCAPVDPPATTETTKTAPAEQPPPTDIRPPVDPLAKPTAPGFAAPDALTQRVDAAIDQVRRRQLRTDNGFWTIFHGILGLGPTVTLYDIEKKEAVNALDYLAAGGKVPGVHFIPTPIPGEPDGLDVETGPGTFVKQGHQDQFVAEMVEWGVPPDKKFVVNGKDFKFDDFLRCSKAHASLEGFEGAKRESSPVDILNQSMQSRGKAKQELEWTLVIVGSRFGTDIQWTNDRGEQLRFEELVRAELDKDVNNAACGGTHLMFGLTWVYQWHMAKQKPGTQPEGVWKEIADRTAEYIKKAHDTQNGDGSFSTDYFRGRANVPDFNARIATTGHIFEWLSLAMSDDELRQQWMQSAASALAMMILENERSGIEGGSMYHAVHGLLIYRSRVYGPFKSGDLKDLKPHVPPAPRIDPAH